MKFWPVAIAKLKSGRGVIALWVLSALLLTTSRSQAQTETVLYSFGSTVTDGYSLFAGLVMDKDGNLYGTTLYGGAGGAGTVFKVTPSGKETILHGFTYLTGDGVEPSAGLILDQEGNLYGTTFQGGANNLGAVFELTSDGTETVLYSFGSQSGDGTYPAASLTMDKRGNLYGTTQHGGGTTNCYQGCGTVFKLTRSGQETVLHSYGVQPGDGIQPLAGLVLDDRGNLYGTTFLGGAVGIGTVFKLTPEGAERVLHSFSTDQDGDLPTGNLMRDTVGNLYGTTTSGGTDGNTAGTVFKVTPDGTETVFYSFSYSQSSEGAMPSGGVITDRNGNLFGTTQLGGAENQGAVYRLSPAGRETLLYSFGSHSGDGFQPEGGLVVDKTGTLFGTTLQGGDNMSDDGTVYSVALR
jgi:uncharacterized repeat protein (TIGR03803 family)